MLIKTNTALPHHSAKLDLNFNVLEMGPLRLSKVTFPRPFQLKWSPVIKVTFSSGKVFER